MSEWVARLNIARFKGLIRLSKDPAELTTLQKLLEEEEAKLAALLKKR